MAVTVAQGVVVIEADTKSVAADVGKSLFSAQPVAERGGRQIGDGFVKAFSATTKNLGEDTLAKLKTNVESTAKRVEAARDKEADAAGKVRVAEKLLAEAREKYSDDSSKVVGAEERLEDALRKQRAAQKNALGATEDNTRALGLFGDAAKRAADASDRAADDIANDGERAGRGWVDSFKGSFLGNALADVAMGAAQQIGDIIGTGIRAAWDFGWSSINVASGLSEADTALESIFGTGKGAVDSFAEGAAGSIGQSELAAKKAAQTFGVYGKAAGLAGDENAAFSNKLVGLASDFASFYDTSPEQAIEAIGAALRGEAEPIRSYGVLLDDATLRARAFEMGLTDSVSNALDPQTRALAANAEILAQADVAAGDFAKTSDGLANQQRILAANFEDAKGKLGESLLPVMSQLVTFANDEFMPVFGDVIDKVGPELGDALVEALPSVMEFMSEFVEYLPELVELGTNALPLIIESGKLLIPVLAFLTENSSTWYGIIGGLLGFLKGDTSLPEFGGKLQGLGGPFAVVLAGAMGALGGFRDFGVWVSRTADTVGSGVEAIGATVATLPGRVMGAMAGAGVWLYNSGRALIDGFISGIRSMIGAVGDAVGGVVDWARSFFPNSPAKRGPLSGAGWTSLKKSGGAVIEQWAEGMREASPGVPFDLMGIVSPSSSRVARPTFGEDALAPGVSAPASAARGETTLNVDLHVTSDDPELAGRQFARGMTKRFGV